MLGASVRLDSNLKVIAYSMSDDKFVPAKETVRSSDSPGTWTYFSASRARNMVRSSTGGTSWSAIVWPALLRPSSDCHRQRHEFP